MCNVNPWPPRTHCAATYGVTRATKQPVSSAMHTFTGHATEYTSFYKDFLRNSGIRSSVDIGGPGNGGGEPLRLNRCPRVDGRTRLRNVTNCGALRNRTRARSPLLSPRNCLLRANITARDGFSINHRPNQLRRTLDRNEFGEESACRRGRHAPRLSRIRTHHRPSLHCSIERNFLSHCH